MDGTYPFKGRIHSRPHPSAEHSYWRDMPSSGSQRWVRVWLECSELVENPINRKILFLHIEAKPIKTIWAQKSEHLSPNNTGSWPIRDIYWKSTFGFRFGYLTHIQQTVWGTSGDQKSSKPCAIDRSRWVDVFKKSLLEKSICEQSYQHPTSQRKRSFFGEKTTFTTIWWASAELDMVYYKFELRLGAVLASAFNFVVNPYQ